MRSILLVITCLVSSIPMLACDGILIKAKNSNGRSSVNLNLMPKDFTAFGNKPKSWRAVIDDNKIVLEGSFLELTTSTYSYKETGATNAMVYKFLIKNQLAIMKIERKNCIDDNDYKNKFTATLNYKNTTYRGCAVEGIYETAPT